MVSTTSGALENLPVHLESVTEGHRDKVADRVRPGEQGMMFGYATTETEESMPLPIMLAHRIARALLRDLDLRRPIYAKTAAYGHFGRADHDFTCEAV